MKLGKKCKGGAHAANTTPKQALTVEPIQTSPSRPTHQDPEFVRVPDLQRLCGLKRGLAYRLISNGTVKSVLLRERGNKQGVRLVYWPSVREYLFGVMAETPTIDARERGQRQERARHIRTVAGGRLLVGDRQRHYHHHEIHWSRWGRNHPERD